MLRYFDVGRLRGLGEEGRPLGPIRWEKNEARLFVGCGESEEDMLTRSIVKRIDEVW